MSEKLTLDEICIIEVLKKYGELSTGEIIELARNEEFQDICSSCEGGDSFVRAAKKLLEKGIVERKFDKGYIWKLKEEK